MSSHRNRQADWARITLRLPKDVHGRLVEAAPVASLNATIVTLLDQSLPGAAPTAQTEAALPSAKAKARPRHQTLRSLIGKLETVRDEIETFLDDPHDGEVMLEAAEDDDIFEELKSRDIEFCAWDDVGDVIAGDNPTLATVLGDDAVEDPELFEAVSRLRRGDLFEALIHLERAIPALDGLHDAVRKLQR